MCKLKFLQKLLCFDQIWADCSKNSKTPFSVWKPFANCWALLQQCWDTAALPKLDVCRNYGLSGVHYPISLLQRVLAAGFSMFLRKTHPKAATWAWTNWAWKLKVLWAVSGSTDLLWMSSHTASWLCSSPACKKHLLPSRALTYCISFLPKSAPQSAFSLLVSTPRSRPFSPQGSPVQFGRCTGTGLQVPFWGHIAPVHVPGISPLGLGVWAGGAVMAFAPISHPKPTQYQRISCPQGRWWQREGAWPHLCATNGIWTDGVQWREGQPTDLWSAVKKYRWKAKESKGDVFYSPSPLAIDSLHGHPSNARCRAGYWCYQSEVRECLPA